MEWVCRDRTLDCGGPPFVMGILNLTPDSFSDGGRYPDVQAAIHEALKMHAAGAAIIDVGGESTRPGADAVSLDEELHRVLPVITQLAMYPELLISVDTRKAEVARMAIKAGAHIINDVSAMTGDPAMADVVAESGAGIILMHMQGTPDSMQDAPAYQDVVTDLVTVLQGRIDVALQAGIQRRAIAIDPGVGFGKTCFHNLEILANLDAFSTMGCPVVVGMSRKRFLEALTGRPVNERLAGSLAAAVWATSVGADIIRVHDVEATRDAVTVADAIGSHRRFPDRGNALKGSACHA